MNELKFNSQICTTIEQSKRLLGLGLKPETADMCWFDNMQKPFCAPYKHFVDRAQELKWVIFPAWSLHRLIELYTYKNETLYYMIRTPNSFDGVINDIAKIIGSKYFNKEYLKQ